MKNLYFENKNKTNFDALLEAYLKKHRFYKSMLARKINALETEITVLKAEKEVLLQVLKSNKSVK